MEVPRLGSASGRKRSASTCGKEKRDCKDCGGSALCSESHGPGRIKAQCTGKECGGSAICPYGRRKGECKERGGSAIITGGKSQRARFVEAD